MSIITRIVRSANTLLFYGIKCASGALRIAGASSFVGVTFVFLAKITQCSSLLRYYIHQILMPFLWGRQMNIKISSVVVVNNQWTRVSLAAVSLPTYSGTGRAIPSFSRENIQTIILARYRLLVL